MALTAVNCTPMGIVSVMITGPAGNSNGTPQEPPGARTGRDGDGRSRHAEREVGSFDDACPGNFTNLQKSRRRASAESVKVTIVCAPAMTVTVAVPAAKLLAASNPALGKVETAVIDVPLGRVSDNQHLAGGKRQRRTA